MATCYSSHREVKWGDVEPGPGKLRVRYAPGQVQSRRKRKTQSWLSSHFSHLCLLALQFKAHGGWPLLTHPTGGATVRTAAYQMQVLFSPSFTCSLLILATILVLGSALISTYQMRKQRQKRFRKKKKRR